MLITITIYKFKYMELNKLHFRTYAVLIILATLSLSSCVGLRLNSEKVTGVTSSQVWFEEDIYNLDSVSTLLKKDGQDFKVLLLADTQIRRGNRKGTKHVFKLIDELIKKTNPDFIVTLGDNSAGFYSDKMATKLSNYLAGYDIPWAVVLGNHDCEGRKGRSWFGNHYEAAANSLFQYGPSNIHGVGNFSVNLKDENGDVIYSFIMLDSNTYRYYEEGKAYDFIHRDQMNWYKWQIEGVSSAQYGIDYLQDEKIVPSMCFFHIPLMEFADAAEKVKDGSGDAVKVQGVNNEGVASAKINSGFFDVMKNINSTTHVFCGHDHINNLSVDWKGINLSYGLKSGKTSYFDEKLQGGTLLTIKAEENNRTKSTAKVNIDYIFVTE
jgi:3',5'-cyclic AMP phosphodiesterase CpdA